MRSLKGIILTMITKEFTIKSIKNNQFELESQHTNGCLTCTAKKSCGIGVLAKYFQKPLFVNMDNNKQVGDTIELKISEAQLLRDAFMLYIMPLLLMFFVGFVSLWVFPNNDFLVASLSIGALLLSFFYLKNNPEK